MSTRVLLKKLMIKNAENILGSTRTYRSIFFLHNNNIHRCMFWTDNYAGVSVILYKKFVHSRYTCWPQQNCYQLICVQTCGRLRIWTSLYSQIRNCDSLCTFKSKLKMHLFIDKLLLTTRATWSSSRYMVVTALYTWSSPRLQNDFVLYTARYKFFYLLSYLLK